MRLVSRPSKLALIQAELVKKKIEENFPDTHVDIIAKSSLGDLNQDAPIYALGEKDVFTKDIDAWLISGTADIAVHSMKDVSVEQYAGNNFVTAVIEREIPHDIIIFNGNIEKLIAENKTIRIGTSSLRREELVPPFLKKALPHGATTEIKILPIRGNVDTRLKKLRAGDFDGIVLAAAGLNRLLKNDSGINDLLIGTKKFLLPLIECTPAPAQGAILAVANSDNKKAVEILERLNNVALSEKINAERTIMKKYGGGCHQKFGVHAVDYRDGYFLVVAGKNESGENISSTVVGDHQWSVVSDQWSVDGIFFENIFSEKNFSEKKNNFFSATDFMKSFFEKKYFSEKILREKKIFEKIFLKKNIFVAHHHAVVENKKIIAALKNKNVWTAGTRTWFELAKRGVWVEGCADGFGFDWLQPVFEKNIINIAPEETLVITNDNVEADINSKFETASTYKLIPTNDETLISALKKADIIFWTSFMQFHFYKQYVRDNVKHCCPSGRTAEKLTALGLNPIVFPSIKVFLEWREKHIEVV